MVTVLLVSVKMAKEVVDVIGWRLDDVVQLIKGERDQGFATGIWKCNTKKSTIM